MSCCEGGGGAEVGVSGGVGSCCSFVLVGVSAKAVCGGGVGSCCCVNAVFGC